MRRRGTMLICDICHNSVFVKNLKNYNKSKWKRVESCKQDICPECSNLCRRWLHAEPAQDNLYELFRIVHTKKKDTILS